jgi:hypothetical protein
VLFFGLVAVGGSYYLQTLSISPAALLAGAMVGLFAAAVITVNNTRDLDTDRRAGRRTLAVVLGRRAAGWVYCGELLLPFVLLPCLALLIERGVWLVLPLLTLPPVLRLTKRFRQAALGPAFNQLLVALLACSSFLASCWRWPCSCRSGIQSGPSGSRGRLNQASFRCRRTTVPTMISAGAVIPAAATFPGRVARSAVNTRCRWSCRFAPLPPGGRVAGRARSSGGRSRRAADAHVEDDGQRGRASEGQSRLIVPSLRWPVAKATACACSRWVSGMPA